MAAGDVAEIPETTPELRLCRRAGSTLLRRESRRKEYGGESNRRVHARRHIQPAARKLRLNGFGAGGADVPEEARHISGW